MELLMDNPRSYRILDANGTVNKMFPCKSTDLLEFLLDEIYVNFG